MAVKCAAWIACVLAKPVSVAMTSSSLSKTRSHVFSPRSFSSRDFIDPPSRPEARRRTAPSLSNNAVHRTCRRMSMEEVEAMAHVVALVLTLALVAPAAANVKILEPHDPTWERIFKISWQMDEKKAGPDQRRGAADAPPCVPPAHARTGARNARGEPASAA